MGSRFDHRRASGSMGGIYDRPPVGSGHNRTPSPTQPRRGYDSYAPPRPAPSYREESQPYRSNVYRPGYPPYSFYGAPPESDPYATAEPRPYPNGHWGQTKQGWYGSGYNQGWQDSREPIPLSPTGTARNHGRSDMLATRMFEPGEGAKHPPPDRWARHEGSTYAQGKYYDPPPRTEAIMDSLTREAPRASYSVGADRYRQPPHKRASYPNMRSEYDSYRPPCDTKRDMRGSFQREPPPPPSPSRSYRMDSTPPLSTSARGWSQHEPPAIASQSPQFPRSISRPRTPEWRTNGSTSSSPRRQEASNSRSSWDQKDVSGKKKPSRHSSRSSIASTQISDVQSAEDTQPVSKPLESSTPTAQATAKVVSAVLQPHSSGPSSTCSSPRQLLLSEPRTALANGIQALDTTTPSSSPLSSVVTDESEVPAAKFRTLANVPKSPSPLPCMSPLSPIDNAYAENPVGSTLVNGAVPATSNDDVSMHTLAISKENGPDDKTRTTQEPIPRLSASGSNPAPSSNVSATKGAEMDVDNVDDAPPLPQKVSAPAKEVSSASEAHEEPSHDEAFVFKGFAASPFPHNFVPEAIIEFDEDLPRREPEILLELQPLFPPNSPIPDKQPSVKNPESLQEALRAVVMARLVYDKQTRDELVNPVLFSNRALVDALPLLPTAKPTPHHLIGEVHRILDETVDYPLVRESLAHHFEERQNLINDKAHRLSEEYLRLHKKWKAHCDLLDIQQRNNTTEAEQLLHGRTTRRTAAFTDTVRSDLEMEQVIASLGVDDLTDANYLSSRNAATIPDMIAVTEGEVDYLFDDTNHLVENPEEYYGPHTGIDDWTEEEKRIFIDKFAMYPKQFGLIADHIPYKTAAQCVDYYYLHKKRMIDFRKVVSQLAPNKRKRRGGGKKKGNALLTDIAQHDAEVGKDQLSTFIVPSRVAKGKRRGKTATVKAHSSTPAGANTPQPEAPPAETLKASKLQVAETTPMATPTPEPEGRPKRSNRKSGVGAAQPSATSTPAPIPPPTLLAASISRPASVTTTPSPAAASSLQTIEISLATPPPLAAIPTESPQKLVKKVKRGRKQVKSAAIIIEEPPSPPPEAETPIPGSPMAHE